MELFESGQALVNGAGQSDVGYFIIVVSSLLGVVLFVLYMISEAKTRFFASAMILLVPTMLAMGTGVGIVLSQDKNTAGGASQWIAEAEAKLVDTYHVESVVIRTDHPMNTISRMLSCEQDFECPDVEVSFTYSQDNQVYPYKVSFTDNKHGLELVRVDALVPSPADIVRGSRS